MKFECKCSHKFAPLHEEDHKILEKFTKAYDVWYVSDAVFENSLMETQRKFLYLLDIIHKDMFCSHNGRLASLVKQDPPVKVRVYEYEADREHMEWLNLPVLILKCATDDYSSHYPDPDEFSSLGGTEEEIREINSRIEEKQYELFQYQDLSCIFE